MSFPFTERLRSTALSVQREEPKLCRRNVLLRSHQEVFWNGYWRINPKEYVTLFPWQQIVRYRSRWWAIRLLFSCYIILMYLSRLIVVAIKQKFHDFCRVKIICTLFCWDSWDAFVNLISERLSRLTLIFVCPEIKTRIFFPAIVRKHVEICRASTTIAIKYNSLISR